MKTPSQPVNDQAIRTLTACSILTLILAYGMLFSRMQELANPPAPYSEAINLGPEIFGSFMSLICFSIGFAGLVVTLKARRDTKKSRQTGYIGYIILHILVLSAPIPLLLTM